MDVHQHIFSEEGKKRSIFCKYCSKVLPDNKERWRSHLSANCEQIPVEKKELLPHKKQKVNTVKYNIVGSDLTEMSEVTPSESASQYSKKITDYVCSTTSSYKNALDAAFAKCFFDTGIPFNFADSFALQKFD